ncbi:3959_t:CDS:2 [Entrophospora sp. SA101]|nr:3959_t:CDS:2 [Entrophospora sp. SA101]
MSKTPSNTSPENYQEPRRILTIKNLKHTNYDNYYGRFHALVTCDESEVEESPCEDYLEQAKLRLESWTKIDESTIL